MKLPHQQKRSLIIAFLRVVLWGCSPSGFVLLFNFFHFNIVVVLTGGVRVGDHLFELHYFFLSILQHLLDLFELHDFFDFFPEGVSIFKIVGVAASVPQLAQQAVLKDHSQNGEDDDAAKVKIKLPRRINANRKVGATRKLVWETRQKESN